MGVRVQALTEFVEDRRDELPCDDALGRDERFEEMVTRQARFLFQVAFGLLRNRQDAEDAVGEVHRTLLQEEEADRAAEHAEGGERSWAVAVRQDA